MLLIIRLHSKREASEKCEEHCFEDEKISEKKCVLTNSSKITRNLYNTSSDIAS